MNSISKTPDFDLKSFFPRADEINDNLINDLTKKINSSKSDLANTINREIKEFQQTGKPIEVDLISNSASLIERNQVKLMLYDVGWNVEVLVKETQIKGWAYPDGGVDKTLVWKISKKN